MTNRCHCDARLLLRRRRAACRAKAAKIHLRLCVSLACGGDKADR
jgi:hypothetical protein